MQNDDGMHAAFCVMQNDDEMHAAFCDCGMYVAFAEEVDAAFDQNKSIYFEHQARYGIIVN